MEHPDPFSEIRMTKLQATRGANFWSSRPVTRMDLAVGAYDDISSADVPGVVDALVAVMPGFIEHRCSIGERGGFIMRLRRGTYAPHIIEHIALELQNMIGHDVGYGRTRGGDAPDEYTIVFEHRSEEVGREAATLAVDTVQHAFAGRLSTIQPAVDSLRELARAHAPLPTLPGVRCGITGGTGRADARDDLLRRLGTAGDSGSIVDVTPTELLEAGLPYATSEIAIILDAELTDVPPRYREPDRARRLVTTVLDAVPHDGMVVVPAAAWDLHEEAREADCRVAVFTTNPGVTRGDMKFARSAAYIVNGRVLIEHPGGTADAGEVNGGVAPAPQVAAALAAFLLESGAAALPREDAS